VQSFKSIGVVKPVIFEGEEIVLMTEVYRLMRAEERFFESFVYSAELSSRLESWKLVILSCMI